MDPVALEIFLAVAAELSITRASQRLGRVQSNVTTRIQQLEKELGVALFLREGKRLGLTPEGERFTEYANRMLALTEEMRQVLHPLAPAGTLRVGSMESTAASRLPEPLSRYHRQWPGVRLSVSTAPSRSLIESVRNSLLDCALVALYAEGGIASLADLNAMGLQGRKVFREELLLLLPASHPPVRRPADVKIRCLAAFAQGCSYRALVEDWLSHDKSSPLDIQEVGSYHAMLACVASGTCVCLLPRSVLELMRESTGVQAHAVARVDTWLVWRDGYDTAAFSALRETLPRSVAAKAIQ